jgi:hypothetical protein
MFKKKSETNDAEKVVSKIETLSKWLNSLPFEVKRKARNRIIEWANKLEDEKYKEEGGVMFRSRLTGKRAGSVMDWEDERDALLKSLNDGIRQDEKVEKKRRKE